MKTLAELRSAIDQLDKQLQEIITHRVKLAIEVGEVKRSDTSKELPAYCPEREAEILQKVVARNNGPLADQELAKIFQTIIAASRSIQQPTKIT